MNIEEMKKQISVVIQGPIDDRTYEAVDCYKDFGETIISTWDNQDLSLLNKTNTADVKIYATNHRIPQNAINEGGRFYQAVTTFIGAKSSSCAYVMKTRSDELYPDLDIMLQNLIDHPDRSHTTNNGFWKHHPFCYSNHLFIDKKNIIENAMQSLILWCLGISYTEIQPKHLYCAESAFGFFLMLARGKNLANEDWRKVFRENVFITPCSHLKGHLHSGASIAHNGGFKRSSEPYPNGRLEAAGNIHPLERLYNDYKEF